MGSDDGAKGREGKGAASLGTLLFLVCFVAPMLLVEQYLVKRRGLTLAKLKDEARAVRAHPGQAIGDAVRIVEGEARDAIERGRNLERHIEAMLHRQRPPEAPQVVATPVIAPKPTKPLREMLLDLALLAPRDALAAGQGPARRRAGDERLGLALPRRAPPVQRRDPEPRSPKAHANE